MSSATVNLDLLSPKCRALIERAAEWGWTVHQGSSGWIVANPPAGSGAPASVQVSVPAKAALNEETLRRNEGLVTRWGVNPVEQVEAHDITAPAEVVSSEETPSISAEVVTVTPELALDWLTNPKFKAPNRTIRKSKLQTYSAAMRAGRWQLTGEAIKFDTEGKLVDGQHRLSAVVDSEVSVQMMVVRGVPVTAQNVMDTGAGRTTGDVLNINGVGGNYQAIASAGRLLVAIERGELTPKQAAVRVGNDEVLDYVHRHEQFTDFISRAMTSTRRVACPQSALLAAVYLIAQRDEDAGLEFLNRLAGGTNLDSRSPVWALRERLTGIQINRERHPPYVIISAILRCYNAWARGEQMGKVVLYRGEEPVAMPQVVVGR